MVAAQVADVAGGLISDCGPGTKTAILHRHASPEDGFALPSGAMAMIWPAVAQPC
jgi:hypothetical protein